MSDNNPNNNNSSNPVTEKEQTKLDKVFAWIKKHKKPIIWSSIIVVLTTWGIIKHDEIYDFFESIISKNPYDHKYFSNATNEELATDREKVRSTYQYAKTEEEAGYIYDLLHRFDDEIRIRNHSDNDSQGSLPHRENGWYLPNDD